jgi:hypothetical protein
MERNLFFYFVTHQVKQFVRPTKSFYSITSSVDDVPLLAAIEKDEKLRGASHLKGELIYNDDSLPITVLNVSRHGLLFELHNSYSVKGYRLTQKIILTNFLKLKMIWHFVVAAIIGMILNLVKLMSLVHFGQLGFFIFAPG